MSPDSLPSTPLPPRPFPFWPVTLALSALTLAWDASGLDLAFMRWLGNRSGFALRNHWLLDRVLHDAVHQLAYWVYAALLLVMWRPWGPLRRLGPWQRLEIVCGVSLGLILVGVIKGLSRTSCPWDLAEFGGLVPYVSHWNWTLSDGGSGHCFPAGHASSAYAFLAIGLPWLDGSQEDRNLGRTLLLSVLLIGLTLGLAQTLRGAHYPSHTWWTILVCWLVALGNRQVFARWRAWPRRKVSETA